MKNISVKRIISAICVVLLLLSVFSAITFPAFAKTVTIDDLKAQYPEGKYWNGGDPDTFTDKPCTHHGDGYCSKYGYDGWCGCNSYKGVAIQCMGFAYQLAYIVYGGNPYQWTTKIYDKETAIKNLKPGDVVRYRNGGHSIFITNVEGETVTFADCNWNHNCNIRWDRTISKSTLKGSLTYVHSAPYEWGTNEPTCDCSTSYAGEYKCITESSPLRIRADHNTTSDVIGSIPSKAIVTVSKANGKWAHITYNEIKGFASMEYLQLVKGHAFVELDESSVVLGVDSNKTKTLSLSFGNLPDDAEIDFKYDKNIISATVKGSSVTITSKKEGKTTLEVLAVNSKGTVAKGSCEVIVNKCNHTYTNACDAVCNKCPYERQAPHNYGEYVSDKNATIASDGTKTRICKSCKYADTVVDVGTKLIDSSKKYSDVSVNAWYKTYVDYAINNDIFDGMSETEFMPETSMTRAQFVQVLANLSGVNTSNKNVKTKFTDVPSGKWCAPAIKWASENNIVSGMGEGLFSPDSEITREQMCLMLTNYAKYRKITLKQVETKQTFADDSQIATWAKDAVYKCQMANLVGGVGDNNFSPKTKATRAQCATVFTELHKNYLV